jgi:hypothetical protein
MPMFVTPHAVPTVNEGATITSATKLSGELASEESTLPMTSQTSVVPKFTMYNEPSVSFDEFFARPIILYETSWTSALTFGGFGQPYNTYLNNAAVLRKIYGYSRMRMTMHFRIEFHPTAFHFGNMYIGIDYNYNVGSCRSSVADGWAARQIHHFPHVVLNAAAPATHELSMPFSQNMNYLDITRNLYITTSGPDVYSPFLVYNCGAALGFSNAAVVPAVAVTIRAWCTDVELKGPTGYAPFSQAGVASFPEIGSKGPISNVLAAVGDGLEAARSRAPNLGPWLQPFHGLASFGAGIASLFGLSSPPDTRTPVPVVMRGSSSYATTDAASSSQALTLLSTSGTSPSSDMLGVSGLDELHMSTWIQAASFLGTFTWTMAGVSGDVLAAFPVSPRFVPYDTATWIMPTSLWYVSAPFSKWRGSMIYTITAYASQQHRGRLRIVYEPVGVAVGTEPVGQRFNCVFDLDATRTIDLCVAWSHTDTWLDHPMSNAVSAGGSPARWVATGATYSIFTDNGSLIFTIEAPLTAPQASNNDIQIEILVRGGPDYMLAHPDLGPVQYFTPAVNQAGRGSFPTIVTAPTSSGVKAGPSMCYINGQPQRGDSVTLASCVESPVSIRSLIKRFCYYKDITSAQAFQLDGDLFTFVSYGINVLPNYQYVVNTVLNDVVNFHPSVGFINWFSIAYRFARGSVRWRFLPFTPAYVANGSAGTSVPNAQLGYTRMFASQTSAGITYTSGSSLPGRALMVTMASGGAIADKTAPLDVTVHMYSQFNAINPRYSCNIPAGSVSSYDPPPFSVYMEGGFTNATSTTCASYVAAGDDLTFAGFVGPPPLRVRAGIT